MKRYSIISFSAALLLLTASCGSNTQPENKSTLPTNLVNNPLTANGMDTVAAARKPTMDFQDTVHDFGTIHEGEVVQHEFTFKNNGKTPLIIASATGSCGCTVPEYPKDPVQPGQTAIMKVTFNSAGKRGSQTKLVTVHANTIKNIHLLVIKANIEQTK